MTFDPDTIMAYIDGELDLVTARRVERAALEDAALAARIAQQRALKTRLAAHFDPVLDEDVPRRLTRPLRGADTRLAVPARRFGWPTAAAMAASLVLGLLIGPQLFAPSGDPLTVRDRTLVADGALAAALDTQLASLPPSTSDVRIGLTFQDREGAICRSFSSPAVAGIACRQDNEWAVRKANAGAPASAYRQAAAGDLMEDIDAMRAGEIADRATEKAWRENGWMAAPTARR
jgi:hypothetical protein